MTFSILISFVFLFYFYFISYTVGKTVQKKYFFLPSNYFLTFIIGFFCVLTLNFFFTLWFTIFHSEVLVLFYFLIVLNSLILLWVIINYKYWFFVPSRLHMNKKIVLFWTVFLFLFLLFYFSSISLKFNTDPHLHYGYILYILNLNHILGNYYDFFTNLQFNNYIYLVQSFYTFEGILLNFTHINFSFFVHFDMAALFVFYTVSVAALVTQKLYAKKNLGLLANSISYFIFTGLFLSFIALGNYQPGEGNCWRMLTIVLFIYLMIVFVFSLEQHWFLVIFINLVVFCAVSFSNSALFIFLFLFICAFFASYAIKKPVDLKAFYFSTLTWIFFLWLTFFLGFSLLLSLLAFFCSLVIYILVFFLINDRFFSKKLRIIPQKAFLFFTLGLLFLFILLNFILYLIYVNTNASFLVFPNSAATDFFVQWKFKYVWLSAATPLIIVGLLLLFLIPFCITLLTIKKNSLTNFLGWFTTFTFLFFYDPLTSWMLTYFVTSNAFLRIQNNCFWLSLLTIVCFVEDLDFSFAKKLAFKSKLIKKNRFKTGVLAIMSLTWGGLLGFNYYSSVINNDLNNNLSWYTKALKGEIKLFQKLDETNVNKEYSMLGDVVKYYYFTYQGHFAYTRKEVQTQNLNNPGYRASVDFQMTNWNNIPQATLDSYAKLASRLDAKYIIKLKNYFDKVSLGENKNLYSLKSNLSTQFFNIYEK